MCAFDAIVGKGRAVIIAAAYPCDLPFYKSVFEQLGATAKLTHDCDEHGIFSTSTANEEGERFIHLMNLDGFDKTLKVYSEGEALFGGRDSSSTKQRRCYATSKSEIGNWNNRLFDS